MELRQTCKEQEQEQLPNLSCDFLSRSPPEGLRDQNDRVGPTA